MRALLISLALGLALPPVAVAASALTLVDAPVGARILVLDGRVWRCEGSACQASGHGRSQALGRECARVARKLGPLSAFSRDGVSLIGADLDRCNREARVR